MITMMIWLILGLNMIKVEAVDGVCVNSSSIICECLKTQETTLSIECCEDKIIQLETAVWPILHKKTNDTCIPPKGNRGCLSFWNTRLTFKEKLVFYNKCTGKKRCNITLHPSNNTQIQIPVKCVPATRIYPYREKSSTNFTEIHVLPLFYIAGNDYIGKQISYNCTATTTNDSLYMEVSYIHLGSKSCEKVKMYLNGVPTFKLVCTESGVTMFYKYFGLIGREFSLEIKDVELEEDEVIFLRLGAKGLNISVSCHGKQKDTAETLNTPRTTHVVTTVDSITGVTENSKIVGGDGGDINPYVLFGGIVAALVVINLVCIGVYCLLRNRKRPKDTNTNVAMSNRVDNENDNIYSHYNYVDIADTQITNFNSTPTNNFRRSPRIKYVNDVRF